jgi:hypothetical protein
MYELRSLQQTLVRVSGFSILVLALALGLVTVPAAQAAPGGPANVTVDSGRDVTATGDGDEEEDVDEWEGDILKSVAAPAPPSVLGHLSTVLARLFDGLSQGGGERAGASPGGLRR